MNGCILLLRYSMPNPFYLQEGSAGNLLPMLNIKREIERRCELALNQWAEILRFCSPLQFV